MGPRRLWKDAKVTGLEWLAPGLNALRGAGRRARLGMWDYLTTRAHVDGRVELERERNRGAVDKMTALPPNTKVFVSHADGGLRIELDPQNRPAVPIDLVPLIDVGTDNSMPEENPPRQLAAPAPSAAGDPFAAREGDYA